MADTQTTSPRPSKESAPQPSLADDNAPLRHPLTVLCVLAPLAIIGELYRFLSERKAGLLADDHWAYVSSIIGIDTPWVPAIVLIVGCIGVTVIKRLPWQWPLPSTIGLVLLWAVIWATLRWTMGMTGSIVYGHTGGTTQLSSIPWIGQVGLAITGALQEEILFRAIILALLAHALKYVSGRDWPQYAIALPISAILFSLAHTSIMNHHPAAEPFIWSHFLQRFAAGLLYGYVFLRQGLAISTLSHGLYNISLLTFVSA